MSNGGCGNTAGNGGFGGGGGSAIDYTNPNIIDTIGQTFELGVLNIVDDLTVPAAYSIAIPAGTDKDIFDILIRATKAITTTGTVGGTVDDVMFLDEESRFYYDRTSWIDLNRHRISDRVLAYLTGSPAAVSDAYTKLPADLVEANERGTYSTATKSYTPARNGHLSVNGQAAISNIAGTYPDLVASRIYNNSVPKYAGGGIPNGATKVAITAKGAIVKMPVTKGVPVDFRYFATGGSSLVLAGGSDPKGTFVEFVEVVC